jgi:flagellar biogenesis protein FliO
MTATASTTTAHPIPFRSSPPVSGSDVVSTIGMTLLVLAVFGVAIFHARRRGWLDKWLASPSPGARPTRQLRLVETLVLSRRTRLLRVRKGDQEWLLAETQSGVTVLRPSDADSEL